MENTSAPTETATPQPAPRPSFIKRFAVPIGATAGIVAIAVAAFIVTPREDFPPAPAATTVEAAPVAPVTTVPSLSPATVRACQQITDKALNGTSSDFVESLVYAHLDIQAAPENYDTYFPNLIDRMIRAAGYHNGTATNLGNEFRAYCQG
jgi:hypothetical protein